MNLITIPAVASLVLLLSTLSRAAPSDVNKASASDVSSDVSDDSELAKRISSFVRIGRPSSFVRIGRGSHFVRIGRPGNFVRIGRGYQSNADAMDTDSGDLGYDAEKRASRFVRIGKGSSFVRIGKAMVPQDKRMSSFVRIGKGYPYGDAYNDDLNKRVSSFVRIGRTPTFALLRSGAMDNAEDMDMAKA